MAIELTTRARRALDELSIEPNLIIRIDGYETLFSAIPVREIITYGYDDIRYGDDDLYYGGLVDKDNQKNYIDSKSTTYTIRQQINYDDEAGGNSISTMNIALVDKNGEVSQLISPGFDLEDILGRKIDVFISFGDSDFFEDSILIFKGFVTKIESNAGLITFKLNHPDNKKKVKLFQSVETALASGINASQTSLDVDDADAFIEAQGPLSSYLRIGSEIIQYTGIAGNTFTGLTRGALGSTPSPHSVDTQVRALYALEGNPLELALQLMISGQGADPIHEAIPVSSILKVGSGTTQIANAIYFNQINLNQDYGLTVGDQIAISGAANGANNFASRTVVDIQFFESGYYVVVDGAPLVLEDTTSAEMATYSQWNSMPDVGMRMKPEEVDIAEHLKIRDFFFSATEMRIYLKEDEIEGKEFLENQLYRPIACYSLPRKTRASVGYTTGPIPGEDIITLNDENIVNPDQLNLVRTTNRSFYNEVVYKYDDDPLQEQEKFTRGKIYISQTSKNRIPGTTKTYVIESLGLKTDLNAENISASNSQRILDRYEFAAEQITTKALMRDTVGLEIGDILIGEFEKLKVTDITKADRIFKPRLFEVLNKTINYKTGSVDLVLLDTGFNLDQKFGLMSPTSPIAGVISQSQFVVGPDSFYGGKYGLDEFRKWESIISPAQPISIRLHNADYSIDEDLVVTDIDENTFTLQDPAVTSLTPGLYISFTGYDDADTSDKQKIVYAYMTDDPAFGDGGKIYAMI